MGIIDPAGNAAAEARGLRTLGLLTKGALHEISNPLVALLGSAELALLAAEPGTKLHDRIALTRQTGAEIAEIVRALQSFVRLQRAAAAPISLGTAAGEAIALVSRVLPTHDATLSSSGDATVMAAPGEVACQLVELLVEALGRPDRPPELELVVATDGGEAVVTATGGGELRLPLC